MRKRVGIATSVVLTGSLYAQQAEEGSVYMWGLAISAVLAYWLGYGLVAGFERLRGSGSASGAGEMRVGDRVAALERLASLHERGLLSGAEFAAAKAELLPEVVERGTGAEGLHAEPLLSGEGVDKRAAHDRLRLAAAAAAVAVAAAVVAAGVFLGNNSSNDESTSICADTWSISERHCRLIIDASALCPWDARREFRLRVEDSYGSGELSLRDAINNATSICQDG